MQPIYKRKPMCKYDFNKIAQEHSEYFLTYYQKKFYMKAT